MAPRRNLTRIISRKGRRRHNNSATSQQGLFLVELLVSLLVGSMIAAVMVDSISAIHRFSDKSQQQLLAVAMAQEVMDVARDSTWAFLTSQIGGSFPLQINSTDSVSPPQMFPRPLLVDSSLYQWSNAGLNNRFIGTAVATVSAPNASSVQVSVTINWMDPEGGPRKYSTSTMIAQSGIHL